jgi:hypothetical protein
MIAYFDTEAFNRLYKKIGCSSADIANLRNTVYGRRLSIMLSIHALEEMLLGRKLPPQAFAAQIKLTLSIASSRTLIKMCSRLLLDDLHSYLNSTPPARPFLRGEMQNVVAEGISSLIETDGEEMEDDFLSLLHQARRDKLRFYAMLERIREQAKTETRPDAFTTFQPYFEANAPPLLKTLLAEAGVNTPPLQSDLNGLLGIRSVRTLISAVLAATFDRRPLSTPNPTSLHHAVCAASVAQTYVTDSTENRKLLAYLPQQDFRVAGLSEFLTRL